MGGAWRLLTDVLLNYRGYTSLEANMGIAVYNVGSSYLGYASPQTNAISLNYSIRIFVIVVCFRCIESLAANQNR